MFASTRTLLLIPLVACQPERPTAPLPSVLIVTSSRPFDPDAFDAVAAEGLVWDEAWQTAPSVRPALASLLTGQLPARHGVRDPLRHAPITPTLATLLGDEGWSTAASATTTPRPLHPGETWGFDSVFEPNEALGRSDPAFIWLHVDDSEWLGHALAWQSDRPHRHLVVTTVARLDPPLAKPDRGRVPLAWVGPGFPAGLTAGDAVSQIDIAATVLDVTGMPTAGIDGTDLRAGGSPTIVQEDARPMLALGLPGIVVERGPGNPVRSYGLDPAPVSDLAPAASTVRVWREDGALPTDPLGAVRRRAPDPERELVAALEIGDALRSGRLRAARAAIEALDDRLGETPATLAFRADLLLREGDPLAAIDALESLYASSPSSGLALRVAHALLDARSPRQAIRWFDLVLDDWSDHPGALTGRLRCAIGLGDDGAVLEDLARLVAIHGPSAARVQLALDLADGAPVDPEEAIRLAGRWPDDAWTQQLAARALWAAGRTGDALVLAEDELRRDPRSIALRLELATWYLELGEPERAVRLVGPVARWFPEDLRVSALYRAAHEAQLDERRRIQALRALWRHSATRP